MPNLHQRRGFAANAEVYSSHSLVLVLMTRGSLFRAIPAAAARKLQCVVNKVKGRGQECRATGKIAGRLCWPNCGLKKHHVEEDSYNVLQRLFYLAVIDDVVSPNSNP